MNPQSVYHAYAMTYIELRRARADGDRVPNSVLARLGTPRREDQLAALRALKDVERRRPMRAKDELLSWLKCGENAPA